jgi:2-methylisocitrate lyase-like PEP mutase family enzyme
MPSSQRHKAQTFRALHSVDGLAAAGVRRISLGSALARAALGAFLGAREAKERGTFNFAEAAASFAEIDPFMQGPPT